MTRQDAAKAMIKDDLIGITEAINICSEETRAHFMLGGLLYIATVVNGAIEWCEKDNINVQSFIDTELITKLRTKAKLYSSDKLIPLEKQKKLMSSIVSTEKQYWIDQQDGNGIPYPDFLIPDVGSYIVNGHYIGNTLEYAYEFSPLNPKKIPILEAICGNSKEESLIYKIAIQIGQTMSSLYDTLGIQRGIKKHYDEITIVTKDHDFRISNHTFFEKENAIYAFNLLCRVNFLLEMLLPLNKNGFLSFRMMYITFYHLKFDLENLGLKEIHYNMPYRNKLFRNAMAHYSLFGKLSTAEIIDNVTGYGLFEKFFEEHFEVINQALINELAKTRDSLEQYVVF